MSDISSSEQSVEASVDLIATALVPLLIEDSNLFGEQESRHIAEEFQRNGGAALFEALEYGIPVDDYRAFELFRIATLVRPYRLGMSGRLEDSVKHSIGAVMKKLCTAIPTLIFRNHPESFMFACKERSPMCSINQILMAGLTVGMVGWFGRFSNVGEIRFTFGEQPWHKEMESYTGSRVRFGQANCEVLYREPVTAQ